MRRSEPDLVLAFPDSPSGAKRRFGKASLEASMLDGTYADIRTKPIDEMTRDDIIGRVFHELNQFFYGPTVLELVGGPDLITKGLDFSGVTPSTPRPSGEISLAVRADRASGQRKVRISTIVTQPNVSAIYMSLVDQIKRNQKKRKSSK
ncbi:hypothetical protein ROJ8625_00307 [Roseivivax jejudonensis]|uniref:Uncharacterized protein n=1 Tax=Roseivivax jejudonensis TaxID=1529041 RepID=A0A1X6Y6U6_9RHOB|nr:hypothetical protein [Roseivivax jejudonensis]SLN12065.1 hypothetical protein ROJ8625_00307 [Roseivivax jejudonensis]